MTDLTERLRARAASHASLKGKGLPAEPWPELFAEAADELDRLRAALARTEANRDAAMQDAAEEHERAEKAKAEIDQLREALQVAEAFISIAVPARAKDTDEAVDVVLPKIRAALQETDR